MPKRVLVTGAAGSLGAHVWCHILANTDWEFVGLDSLRHMGLSERIVEMSKDHPQYIARSTFLTHDLNAPIGDILAKRIGHVDYILNTASLSDVHISLVDPLPFFQNNVNVVLNMLEFARKVRPEAFLHVSSDEVYGPTDGAHRHKEWDPILPSSPYSASKAAQEAACIAWWRSYNVPLLLINLMNLFCELQNPRKFPVLVQKAVAAGEVVTVHGTINTVGTRFYLHARNAADAMLFILQNVPPKLHVDGAIDRPERFNIVGDKQVSNLDLAEMIARYMGKSLRVEFEDFHSARPGHDRHYGLDGSRLRELGWKAPVSFEDSLKEVVRWQSEHPEWIS